MIANLLLLLLVAVLVWALAVGLLLVADEFLDDLDGPPWN